MVLRDGKIQTQVSATIKANGEVWCNSCPMIDSKSFDYLKNEAEIRKICKEHKYDMLPTGVIAHIGINQSGLQIISQFDYEQQRSASITPAQKERAEINNLYYRAKKLENSSSENNVSEPMIIRGRADKMYADWCKKYPEEVQKENKEKLIRKAENSRELARGALTYDCDGSLSPEEQQKRYDTFIRQAEEIELSIK
jgi:hypothetical protein